MKKVLIVMIVLGPISGVRLYLDSRNDPTYLAKKKSEAEADLKIKNILDDIKKGKINQKVLFEYRYSNWAFGTHFTCIFIDNEGYVKEYDFSGSYEDWDKENWQNVLSKSAVEANYAKAKKGYWQDR